MKFSFKKYSVSVLNENWEVLFPTIKVKFLPRYGELIYLSNNYYRVVRVIHNINNKQGVFLQVEIVNIDELKKN